MTIYAVRTRQAPDLICRIHKDGSWFRPSYRFTIAAPGLVDESLRTIQAETWKDAVSMAAIAIGVNPEDLDIERYWL